MRARSVAAWAAVTAAMGPDELLLTLALALVTVGLWPLVGLAALVAPGIVLLWIALPTRSSFVQRTPEPTLKLRKRS
jgi:hypothetical protein